MPESKARFADATALLTSSLSPAAILAMLLFSTGEKSSNVLPEADGIDLPSINILPLGFTLLARSCQISVVDIVRMVGIYLYILAISRLHQLQRNYKIVEMKRFPTPFRAKAIKVKPNSSANSMASEVGALTPTMAEIPAVIAF